MRRCAFWSETRAARAATSDRLSSCTLSGRLWISFYPRRSGARSAPGIQTPDARSSARSAAWGICPRRGAPPIIRSRRTRIGDSGRATRREERRRGRRPWFHRYPRSRRPPRTLLALPTRARELRFARSAQFSPYRAPSSCPLSGKVDGLLTMSPCSHALRAWLARQNPVWSAARPLHIALHNGGSVATAQRLRPHRPQIPSEPRS